MHRVRWDDLQYVHAVAEYGSLSAASRALGVNHATVLRRIALLEAANEVQLFERGKDGYRLRPEGRALLASLKLMDDASARIHKSLALSSKGIEGTFRLATTDSIACLLLPKYMPALRDEHPNIKIEIAVSNKLIDISLSGPEIMIRPGPQLPRELSGVRVGTIEFGVYGAPRYLQAHSGLALDEHKWLGTAPNFAQSSAGDWQQSAIRTGFELSADSFLTLAGLTVQGLGLAMLPVYVGRNTPGLVPVEQFTGGPTTGLWVATHRDFRQQNHIETLLDFFTTAFRSDAQHLI